MYQLIKKENQKLKQNQIMVNAKRIRINKKKLLAWFLQFDKYNNSYIQDSHSSLGIRNGK